MGARFLHVTCQGEVRTLAHATVVSGLQRSGDARGDCLIVCTLPNYCIEQWRIVAIAIGYTLFVTSQYDVIFTFANQRFG